MRVCARWAAVAVRNPRPSAPAINRPAPQRRRSRGCRRPRARGWSAPDSGRARADPIAADRRGRGRRAGPVAPSPARARSQGIDPLRHFPLVADIAGGNDLPPGSVGVEDIDGGHLDFDIVERGVGGDCGGGEMIDLGGEHRAGAGDCRGDRDEARAGAEIEHAGGRRRSADDRADSGPAPGRRPRRRPRTAAAPHPAPGSPRSPARSG